MYRDAELLESTNPLCRRSLRYSLRRRRLGVIVGIGQDGDDDRVEIG